MEDVFCMRDPFSMGGGGSVAEGGGAGGVGEQVINECDQYRGHCARVPGKARPQQQPVYPKT